MKNKLLHLILLFTCSIYFSQQKVTWQELSKVKFADKYFAEHDDFFMHPTFSPSVKKLEGKKITITGYFLDIATAKNTYVLSKGPMSSCFFCGEGGPESVVEIEFINKKNYKTDDIVTITGTFKLNEDDVEHLNYILTACKDTSVK